MKLQKERNFVILKESKKKKKLKLDLEKEKRKLNKELQVLRVKNGILYKDIADLVTDNKSKAIYIKQMEDGIVPSNDDTPEIVEVERPPAVSMNKDSQKHSCNACNKTFAKQEIKKIH